MFEQELSDKPKFPHRYRLHRRQASTASSDSVNVQPSQRYRIPTPFPLDTPVLTEHPIGSMREMPHSPNSSGFEDCTRTPVGGIAPPPQAMASDLPSTDFVASQVNIINITSPNLKNDNLSTCPGPYEPHHPPMPAQHCTPPRQQVQPSNNGGYTDRDTLPSQQQRRSSVSHLTRQNATSRKGTGTQMVNIPPPQNYNTVDGWPRPPTPYANDHASMPMAPITGFGMPHSKGFSETKVSESSSTPKLGNDDMSAHGHRRNKTTISNRSGVVPRSATRKGIANEMEATGPVGAQLGANTLKVKRKALPVYSFDASEFSGAMDDEVPSINTSFASPNIELGGNEATVFNSKQEAVPNSPMSSSKSMPAFFKRESALTTDMRPSSQHSASSPSTKEDFITFKGHKHDRTSSGDSDSTVASDSWNKFYPETLSAKEAPSLKRQHAQSNLKAGQSTQPASTDDPVHMTPFRSRKRFYPLNECIQASDEQGVEVHDFAYLSGKPLSRRHVRFSIHAHHAPSAHYQSNSEDFAASTGGLVDLGNYKSAADGRNTLRIVNQDNPSEEEGLMILPATTYKPAAQSQVQDRDQIPHGNQNDNPALLPGTSHAAPTAPKIDKHDQDSNPTYIEFPKLPQARDQTQKPKKHKRGTSQGLFRRVSNSLSKFAAARSGTEPVTRTNTGVLDRGFEFPARDKEQRVPSMPILQATEGNKVKGHKRRSSLGRLLEGLGVKRHGKEDVGNGM